MLETVPKWTPPGGGSRLVKARSSPNVSKTPLSVLKKATPESVQAGKPPRAQRTPARTSPKTDSPSPRTNLSEVKSRVSSRPRRPSSESRDASKASPTKSEKKKSSKSGPSSCTILEDRALLKKGLSYAPEKIPRKPEALRGKAGLDRSISLGSVSSEASASYGMSSSCSSSIVVPGGGGGGGGGGSLTRKSLGDRQQRGQDGGRRKPTPMNRSISLWSVQGGGTRSESRCQSRRSSGANSRSSSASRPSRIPLLTQRSPGLGRSLADLSQVDRLGAESTFRAIQVEVDIDLDLDHSIDDRIYENCGQRPAENNLALRSLGTSSLEERAALLMAQLDDDDDDDEEAIEAPVSVDVVDLAPPRRASTSYEERETPDARGTKEGENRARDGPEVRRSKEQLDVGRGRNTLEMKKSKEGLNLARSGEELDISVGKESWNTLPKRGKELTDGRRTYDLSKSKDAAGLNRGRDTVDFGKSRATLSKFRSRESLDSSKDGAKLEAKTGVESERVVRDARNVEQRQGEKKLEVTAEKDVLNIQELRRTWERQARGSAERDADSKNNVTTVEVDGLKDTRTKSKMRETSEVRRSVERSYESRTNVSGPSVKVADHVSTVLVNDAKETRSRSSTRETLSESRRSADHNYESKSNLLCSNPKPDHVSTVTVDGSKEQRTRPGDLIEARRPLERSHESKSNVLCSNSRSADNVSNVIVDSSKETLFRGGARDAPEVRPSERHFETKTVLSAASNSAGTTIIDLAKETRPRSKVRETPDRLNSDRTSEPNCSAEVSREPRPRVGVRETCEVRITTERNSEARNSSGPEVAKEVRPRAIVREPTPETRRSIERNSEATGKMTDSVKDTRPRVNAREVPARRSSDRAAEPRINVSSSTLPENAVNVTADAMESERKTVCPNPRPREHVTNVIIESPRDPRPRARTKDVPKIRTGQDISEPRGNVSDAKSGEHDIGKTTIEIKEVKPRARTKEVAPGKTAPSAPDTESKGTMSGKSSPKVDNQSNQADSGDAKRKQSVVKRAKEIEHLVNFFNCKNAEASKDAFRDPWIRSKSGAETSAIEPQSALKKPVEGKNGTEYTGYASDGNCSEDSGHISNENDVEWKDNVECRVQSDAPAVFEKEPAFFQGNERNGVFVAEKKVIDGSATGQSGRCTSSGASSIDSCREDNPKMISDYVAREKWIVSRCTVDGRQIFFRAGTLEHLESQRDEKLTGHIILLQARCRGYLARRKLNTLKLQDLAVRCIQRNVRKLMSVREWPWWRLYVKVAPLLNVHRTEDQLKAKTEELEVLRAKVERLEQERNHLKHDNDKLEAKLSEMTADFAEEHSTSTLAAERIDAETSERLRLERELQDVSEANKNLQQTTERLEMELLYARAADLNGVASDGEDGEDGGVYRQRYEHAIRELEFTKRKMAQQHEDDLEQLVGLKKQLEKKLADAYEEVEEQRQVVGQWKRRVQKLNGEMHDLRLLLEEQTARNNLLEKKQRKFDSETQNLMNDLRQEKAQRERLAREKEIAIAEKFTIEQNLSDARLEIELKEERLKTLSQELEELTFGGKTEEEVAQLKKAKHELEKRSKDQEEELDDLAGQVQLLEQAKLRLEMSIEQQRKEMRKEMQQRDEELEDCRGNAHKKVKALEAQLENEHEERTILLREKHELERRLVAIEEQDRADRAAEAETTQRLKRDLKRTRALLRDAQTMLERSKGDSTGKAALRQLKNQLEDSECARAAAVKAKQALEQELNETQASLEEAMRHRSEAEEKANVANRDRSELLSQLEENEEELAEVLKKYRAAVQQVSAEQAQLQEAQVQIAALEAEKSSLKDQLSELSQRLESVEQLGDPTANSLATRRLEFRTKELESKLELEQTTRARLETQIARLKESVEKLQTEAALLRTKEQTAQDSARRLQRSLRDAREEASSAIAREQEATRARRDIEKSLEAAEAETKVARDDLRLALQRIDDLQSAIQGELDLDCSEEATSENSDSD